MVSITFGSQHRIRRVSDIRYKYRENDKLQNWEEVADIAPASEEAEFLGNLGGNAPRHHSMEPARQLHLLTIS